MATATANQEDTWSATAYNKDASFVYSDAYSTPVLNLLAPQSGERIIDFGCGTGELSILISELVGEHGIVIGVDSSQSMISQAQVNGLTHAFVSDVQDLQFPPNFNSDLHGGYDAVFTNAALHWCKRNPRGVLENAKRILKPGGRFVGEMGGFMNCVGVRSAIHAVLRRRGYDPVTLDPWYFPAAEEYKSLLESAGFAVQEIALHPRLTPLPGPLLDWLRLFCRNSALANMGDEEAEGILQEIQEVCEVDCRDEKGNWYIMYVRLRFRALVRV